MSSQFSEDRDENSDGPLGHADELASRILDPVDVEGLTSRLNEVSKTRPDIRRRVTDLLWLDSLLQIACGHDREHVRSRVQVAMRAIPATRIKPAIESSDPSRLSRGSSRRRLVGIVLVAVAALVLCFWLPPSSGSRTAVAAVQFSIQEAESSGIRLYGVVTAFDETPLADREMQAELYVRGSRQFLLHQRGPLGWFWVGNSGSEHWFAPAVGPVFVGAGPDILKTASEQRPLATPILQITRILQRMANRYELTLLDEVDLVDAATSSSIRCQHIRGVLLASDERLLPNVIELWTARQSGIARRLVLDWNKATTERLVPVRVELALEPTPSDLSDDWFEPAAHHQVDRRVIRVRSATPAEIQ